MTYPEIERQAAAALGRSAIEGPPIDLGEVARAFGIVLVREALPDEVSAALIVEPKRQPIIGVNTAQAKERQRFSVAHELGHYVLHRSQRIHYDGPDKIQFRLNTGEQAGDPQEREANAFAAALLMPRSFLMHDFEQLPDRELTASRLAKRYAVSEVAMTWRLFNLGMGGKP